MTSTFSLEDIKDFAPEKPLIRNAVRTDGYRGIWFTLGFKFEYGDKYSGGLGTYTSNHQPMAEYAPAVKRTFFTYGGTTGSDKRELVIMVSFYDHGTQKVPQPVALYLDPSVDDPHDNAALRLDEAGHVWVFKSGRGTKRPGLIFRSTQPYSVDAWELISAHEFTYPQIWKRWKKTGTSDVSEAGDPGFFLLLTQYTNQQGKGPARNLFWQKSSGNGRTWEKPTRLASFGGHYQTSGQWTERDAAGKPTGRSKVCTFFNYHPGSDVDKRTNLYFAQTMDEGSTWTTACGQPLELPLLEPLNDALVMHYQAQDKCMYTCDVNFDKHGNPLLLCIVSRKGEPGPAGDPREWTLLNWCPETVGQPGGGWKSQAITTSDHNYDMGSLYVNGDEWRIIGPTEKSPQRWGTGGEMAMWVSTASDAQGNRTWRRERQLTGSAGAEGTESAEKPSEFNHSYARRPQGVEASSPFFAFWADGHPEKMSESRLYFTDSAGTKVRRLPYNMTTESAEPEAYRG
ncbi:MAG: BNR-4 repeat-containing protein [Candidatus Methylacidiphilales bacterium]|nr:BNR-4 repeat-containing protein [Candidatus Methylacidiphilales bacterium]